MPCRDPGHTQTIHRHGRSRCRHRWRSATIGCRIVNAMGALAPLRCCVLAEQVSSGVLVIVEEAVRPLDGEQRVRRQAGVAERCGLTGRKRGRDILDCEPRAARVDGLLVVDPKLRYGARTRLTERQTRHRHSRDAGSPQDQVSAFHFNSTTQSQIACAAHTCGQGMNAFEKISCAYRCQKSFGQFRLLVYDERMIAL